MAKSKYFVDIDLNKNELLNLILNKTNTTNIPTPIAGQIIFDEDDNLFKYYDGSIWQTSKTRLDGAIQYKGMIVNYNAPAVSDAQTGDLYLLGTNGVISNYNGATVNVGDFIIYNGSGWDVIQGNVIISNESSKGIMPIATNSETIDGLSTQKAITPANLKAWALQMNKNVIRQRVFLHETIATSGTIFTHELENDNPIVSVYDSSGKEIVVAVKIGQGTITVTVNESDLENATVIIAA
jgi:hypothetical protein